MERKTHIRMEIVDSSSKTAFTGLTSVLFKTYCLGEDHFSVIITISFVLSLYVSTF